MVPAEISRQNWQRHAVGVVVAACVVTGFLISLVLLSFFFAQRVQSSLIAQLERETEKQALILEHFFSERRDNLIEIARSRSLNVYFENKALGMSMEYGLRQSLPPILENFHYYLEHKHLSSEPIFSRIALLEQPGTLLVNAAVSGSGQRADKALGSYFNPGVTEGAILLEENGSGLLVSVSNYLKSSHVGQTLAWINIECLYKHLLQGQGPVPENGRWVLLSGKDPSRVIGATEPGGYQIPSVDNLSGKRLIEYKDPVYGRRLAIWAPIENAGLILLRIIGDKEMPASVNPRLLLVSMTLLGVLILLGALYSLKIFLNSRILSVQLEETIAREALAIEKNAQLALEVMERNRAEESFEILQFSMQEHDLSIVLEKALRDLSSLPWLGLLEGSSLWLTDYGSSESATRIVLESSGVSTRHKESCRDIFLEGADEAGSAILLSGDSDPRHPSACSFPKPHSHIWVRLGDAHLKLGRLDLLVPPDYRPSEHAGRFLVSFSDVLSAVIQRRQSEEALARANEANRVLVESIPLALISLDVHHRVLRLNPAAEDWLQIKAASVSGCSIVTCQLPWKFEGLGEALCQLQSTSSLVLPEDVRFTRKDGQEGFLKVSLCRLSASRSENETGVLLIASDVTEQRQLESHLLLSQKLDALGHLAGGIAHEINTPMQYIDDNLCFLRATYEKLTTYIKSLEDGLGGDRAGGSAELLGSLKQGLNLDYLKEEISHALDDVQHGVLQVSSIVTAMREFSKADSGELRQIDLNEALRNTLTVTHNEWKYVCEMKLDLDPALPGILGNPGEINQVFLSIIVNAIEALSSSRQAAGRAGIVSISSRRSDRSVEVVISDNGPGVPRAVIGRIFDPFFTTKPVGSGVGQGLSLARNIIVQKHKGQLYCESEEGSGAKFIIRLPLSRAAGR